MKNILSLKKFKLFEKKNSQKYDYGCVMLETNYKNFLDAQHKINPNDIFDNKENEFGLENSQHVTILYGIHDKEVSDPEIKQIINDYNKGEIELEIVGIGLFENDKYDVLKYEIKSDHLAELNLLYRNLPHTNSYPKYIPHMTIGYLQPGTGKKYVREFETPVKLSSNSLKYSKSDGSKILFKIGE